MESHPQAATSPGGRKLAKAVDRFHDESRELRRRRLDGQPIAASAAIVPPQWWRTAIADATKALGSNPAATDLKRLDRLAALHEARWNATLADPTALAQWEDSAEPAADPGAGDSGREYVRLDDLGLSSKYIVDTTPVTAHTLLRELMEDTPVLLNIVSSGRQLTARRRDHSIFEAVSNDARFLGVTRRTPAPTETTPATAEPSSPTEQASAAAPEAAALPSAPLPFDPHALRDIPSPTPAVPHEEQAPRTPTGEQPSPAEGAPLEADDATRHETGEHPAQGTEEEPGLGSSEQASTAETQAGGEAAPPEAPAQPDPGAPSPKETQTPAQRPPNQLRPPPAVPGTQEMPLRPTGLPAPSTASPLCRPPATTSAAGSATRAGRVSRAPTTASPSGAPPGLRRLRSASTPTQPAGTWTWPATPSSPLWGTSSSPARAEANGTCTTSARARS